MHFITRKRTIRTALFVLTLCEALSDQSKLSKYSNLKRNINPQIKTQFLKTKEQMQNWLNNVFVNREMKQSIGQKRALTIIRERTGNMTKDTVKFDDPKQLETVNQEKKPDNSESRVQHVSMANVLSQLQLSPQPKIPSKPNKQKTTKLLDLPVAPVVTNNCFNGSICIERLCFRPQPLPTCPTTSKTSSSIRENPAGVGFPGPNTATKTQTVSTTTPMKTTTKPQSCCQCPGICVDIHLCNAKQLPICQALPTCATGHCAQNCCGR